MNHKKLLRLGRRRSSHAHTFAQALGRSAGVGPTMDALRAVVAWPSTGRQIPAAADTRLSSPDFSAVSTRSRLASFLLNERPSRWLHMAIEVGVNGDSPFSQRQPSPLTVNVNTFLKTLLPRYVWGKLYLGQGDIRTWDLHEPG
jgi:hypothetical protein